jgi:hypothetical protein
MRIDFSTRLKDPNAPDQFAKDQAGAEITLGIVARTALNVDLQDERRSGEDKYRAYKLADEIRCSTSPLELKTEQIALIKERIGKAYAAPIMGQCWDLIEAAGQEKTPATADAAA